jgi:hypothetical protein
MTTRSATATTDFTKVFRSVSSVVLTETSGSASVRIQLRSGNTNDDTVLLPLSATAGATASVHPKPPLYFAKGVRLEIISGAGRITIEGS